MRGAIRVLLEISLAYSCPKEVRIVFFLFLETYIIMFFIKEERNLVY
jgi:hypothetical protein